MKITKRIISVMLAMLLVASVAVGVSAATVMVEDTLVDTWFIHNGTRNNFHSYIGVVIKVGPYDINVTAIGRMFYEGNTQEHNLKLVDAATGEDVVGASVTVQGGEVNKFTYGSLENTVTLKAGQSYYLLSEEHYEGDAFAEHGFRTDPNGSVVVTGGVFFIPDETQPNYGYNPDAAGEYGFVGLDIKYTVAKHAVSGTENELVSDIQYAENYLTTLRDHGMQIGTMFTVGDRDIYVSSLGRLYFGGGANAHTMFLVDAATDQKVPFSTVTVPAGGTAGAYTWGDLPNPIKLEAGKKYLVICVEIADDGDTWLEGGSIAIGNEGISLNGSAYWNAGNNTYEKVEGTYWAATSLKYGFSVEEVTDGSADSTDDPPQTGDAIGVIACLLFVSAAALVVLKKRT